MRRSGETLGRPRVLHGVAPEIQEEKVDVLDLIRSGAHELLGRHSVRHVTTDAQPALVRLGDDDGHERGVERAIHLDLDVAQIRVPIDPRACAIGIGHEDLRRAGEWAGTIHESRE